MDLRTRIRHRALSRRTRLAATAVPAAAVLTLIAAPTAASAAGPAGPGPAQPQNGGPPANPDSPAYHHHYRHGVVPTRGTEASMRSWAAQHPGAAAAALGTSRRNLRYRGKVEGIGVTTGREKVYLVFYGSQWGSQGTDGNGDVTLSGDQRHEAPYLQEMFKGLGTNGERWSGVMTQYCQGVARRAQHCPASNSHHVAYPLGGALADVWIDQGRTSPRGASAYQLGREALRAADHFGNTTASANRNAQYVILSPTGTHPDGFNTRAGDFCAWHDWNGDVGVSSSHGPIAFTNMPYVTNAGAGCGAHFVRKNANGMRDGISMVEGHEYAETITDQNPAGGWTDRFGEENADKCAWHYPRTTGGAFLLRLPTGAFAMQGTWSNDAARGTGACRDRHPIVTNP